MKAITILVLSILAAIRPAEAASPTLNPLEIPEYVREWFSGHDFTGKPKVTGKYHQSRLNGTNFQGHEIRPRHVRAVRLGGGQHEGRGIRSRDEVLPLHDERR